MNWYDRGEVYTGEWRNNLPNGVGTHTWLDKKTMCEGDQNRHAVFLRHNRLDGAMM